MLCGFISFSFWVMTSAALTRLYVPYTSIHHIEEMKVAGASRHPVEYVVGMREKHKLHRGHSIRQENSCLCESLKSRGT